jgi:hypothetical protein
VTRFSSSQEKKNLNPVKLTFWISGYGLGLLERQVFVTSFGRFRLCDKK